MTRLLTHALITTALIFGAATLFAVRARADDPPAGDGAKGAQHQAELFERLDANHDGTITGDEATEEHQRLFERLVRRADKNGDHKISREEFMAAPEGPEGRGEGPGGPDGPGGSGQRRGPRGERPEGGPDGQRGPPGGAMGVSAVMRALDTDGDGNLSASELNDAAAGLKKLDKNGDGQVTREELMPPGFASFGGGRGGGPDGPRPQFNPEDMAKRIVSERDKNGDGKLQKEELAERMQERFDRMDANHDGAIDEAELKQGFERRGRGGERPDRPGRPGGPEGRPGGPEGARPDGAGPEGAKTK